MRILIISNYFPPEIGAASNRIFLMAKSLKSELIDVEVACPFPNYPTGKIFPNYKGFYKREKIENIVCHRLFIQPDNSSSRFKRAFSMISFALSLWVLFFKKKTKYYDQIIIQNSPLLVSFSSIILFKKLLNKTIILNVSDLWPQSAVDLGVMKKGSFFHEIFKKIEKFNYKNSNKVLGQSQYILDHISKYSKNSNYLYRNLPYDFDNKHNQIIKFDKITFVYAGLLGVAQGLLKLIRILDQLNLDFEFHIYGDGKEKKEIENFLLNNNKIKYLGSVSKEELQLILPKYHYSFVPLATDIKGAFPSKIYELIANDIPVIYIGKGEAKKFINKNVVGFTLSPEKIEDISILIEDILQDRLIDYHTLIENCKLTSKNKLSFDKQNKELMKFITNE